MLRARQNESTFLETWLPQQWGCQMCRFAGPFNSLLLWTCARDSHTEVTWNTAVFAMAFWWMRQREREAKLCCGEAVNNMRSSRCGIRVGIACLFVCLIDCVFVCLFVSRCFFSWPAPAHDRHLWLVVFICLFACLIDWLFVCLFVCVALFFLSRVHDAAGPAPAHDRHLWRVVCDVWQHADRHVAGRLHHGHHHGPLRLPLQHRDGDAQRDAGGSPRRWVQPPRLRRAAQVEGLVCVCVWGEGGGAWVETPHF